MLKWIINFNLVQWKFIFPHDIKCSDRNQLYATFADYAQPHSLIAAPKTKRKKTTAEKFCVPRHWGPDGFWYQMWKLVARVFNCNRKLFERALSKFGHRNAKTNTKTNYLNIETEWIEMERNGTKRNERLWLRFDQKTSLV